MMGRSGKAGWLNAGILALVALALFLSTPVNGDFWWFDSSRHAMNSAFLRDFLLEGLGRPIEFAKQYYAQYPAINIGFYPPLLYLTTAPFMALFGVSHAVAQAVVLAYTFAAALLSYLLCRMCMDRLSSLATALCILSFPAIALWSRQVQPDVPALALLLACAYCLARHLDGAGPRWLWGCALSLGLALLMRVQTIYAVPAVLALLFLVRYPNRPPFKARLLSMAVAGLIAVPSVLMVSYFSRTAQALSVGMDGMPTLGSLANWTWYATQVPQQIGWPATLLVIAGLAGAPLAWRARRAAGAALPSALAVTGLFCAASWLMFSLISNKEPRFNLPSLPFLFIFAAATLHGLSATATRVALALLAAWMMFQVATGAAVPVVDGFRQAALTAQSLTPQGGKVLVSAHRDGSFIFNMRAEGQRRDIGVVRGDKLFVEMTIMRQLGIRDRNLDQQAIVKLLEHENVTTIVSQPGYLADQPTMQNFQHMLDSGTVFDKVGTVALRGATRPDEHELVIYRRH